MRKHLRFLMMAVAILFVNVAKAADDVTVGDFTFNFYTSGNAYVTSYLGSETSLTLPVTITYNKEGKDTTVNVTGIGSNAFKDNTVLEEVTINNSVTFNFYPGCFEGCTNLKKVVTSGQSYYLMNRAFKNCTSLTQVGPTANTVRLGSNTSAAQEEVFMDCKSIKKVAYKYTQTNIGDRWFKGCISIDSIDFGSAMNIGESAFEGCTSIPNVRFRVGSLASVYSISIGKNAFKGCTSIAHIYTHQEKRPLSAIGEGAFEGCTSLTAMRNWYINGKIYSENALTGITTIGDKAFKGCEKFTRFGSVTSKVLVDGASVGLSAFESCAAITKVEFTEDVTSIGPRAFANCEAITEVTAPWTTPFAIENNTFAFDIYSSATLNVPAGAEATYQATGGWQNFYDTTGIKLATEDDALNGNDAWYTIDGKRLQAEPTTKGIYVRGGKKIVIK